MPKALQLISLLPRPDIQLIQDLCYNSAQNLNIAIFHFCCNTKGAFRTEPSRIVALSNTHPVARIGADLAYQLALIALHQYGAESPCSADLFGVMGHGSEDACEVACAL
ncbi:hypothetical protein HG530_010241 [Fusarium avenaceum]|nr:hypothetical protein HG530_010241 [Fusarium avenaceum]